MRPYSACVSLASSFFVISPNEWSFNLVGNSVTGQGGANFVCRGEPNPASLVLKSFPPLPEKEGKTWVHKLCWMGPWPDGWETQKE